MKTFYIDTNVLIDNPDAVQLLNDNFQNEVLLSYHVLNELDKLKKDPIKGHIVSQIIKNLELHFDKFKIIDMPKNISECRNTDDILLFSKKLRNKTSKGTLVTADKILRLKARTLNILCEEFKRANPFIDITNGDYTGVFDSLEEQTELINNCFYWNNGKLYFWRRDLEAKQIHYTNTAWGVRPRNIYQNMFFELGLNDDIDIVTVQSNAGVGKTFLSLALALHHVLEKKTFNKIYIIKGMYEIGMPLGFLPGTLNDKLAPYMEYLDHLITKLHEIRPANRIYSDKIIPNQFSIEKYNYKKFEIVPINYTRGREFEDAFIIIDEVQNLNRIEVRTLLSRFGENCKCLCIGDISQIDNPYLNKFNNGLNWILRKFKNKPNYAHLTMKSERSRGPICDLVIETGL